MSADEIIDALDGWVARIGALGAAVVPRLRPGLSEEQITEIAAPRGFTLSPEIAAIWAWHDGDRPDSEHGTFKQVPGLTPRGAFLDLDTSLRDGLSRWHSIAGNGAGLADPEMTEEDKGGIWRREWVIFEMQQQPLVLATTADGTTDTFRFDPQDSITWVAHSTLPERIAWWHRYLDLGAWRVEPDGTWGGDNSRLPRVDRTASKAEQIAMTEVT